MFNISVHDLYDCTPYTVFVNRETKRVMTPAQMTEYLNKYLEKVFFTDEINLCANIMDTPILEVSPEDMLAVAKAYTIEHALHHWFSTEGEDWEQIC